MDKIAKFLKENYGLLELPTQTDVQRWYLKTTELKSKGLRSDIAAKQAAHALFKHVILEERKGFEVRTTTDDINTILNIIKDNNK